MKKSRVVYVPKIVYWKKGDKKQKVDLGYWTVLTTDLTSKKKGDKIKSVL
jgi:hypothetical protein